MLHVPSYNMGMAAGTIAKASGVKPPKANAGYPGVMLDDIPGLDDILTKSDKLDMFLPSSFVEGYWNAFNNPEWGFAG